MAVILPASLLAQIPAGFVAKYPLDNNSANDISGNNYNGTLTSTTATVNRFGTSNAALQFSSGTSSGTLPVMVQNDFSVGFWIKTTMNANSGSEWYEGQSLVDAEVCGVVNDWGTALINGGEVCFGVGNPDITIFSPAGISYNDGNWHFVTVTRSESAGTSVLYMDGSEVASGSGLNTGALNSPTIIGLGRNNCTGADYTGALDDIIFYARALSSAEVTTLYNTSNAYALPLDLLSFTAAIGGSGVNLAWTVANMEPDEEFDVQRSADALNYVSIGKLGAKDGLARTDGVFLFGFTDTHAGDGINYYRLHQIDPSGASHYSAILDIRYPQFTGGIYLSPNPVHDLLVINNPGGQQIGEIEILDLTSRVLSRQQTGSTNNLINTDVSKIPPGYYLLRIKGERGAITLPFLKQ